MIEKEQVRKIISKETKIEEQYICDHSRLVSDLLIDSIIIIKIILGIEEYYNVELTNEGFELKENIDFSEFCYLVNQMIV